MRDAFFAALDEVPPPLVPVEHLQLRPLRRPRRGWVVAAMCLVSAVGGTVLLRADDQPAAGRIDPGPDAGRRTATEDDGGLAADVRR